MSALLESVLALPTSCALERLTVDCASLHEPDEAAAVTRALAARPRPALRALHFTTNSEEEMLSWTSAGDLTPLVSACANLERLRVRAGSVQLASADWPGLEELNLEVLDLDEALLAVLCDAQWPGLKSLALWWGHEAELLDRVLVAPWPSLTSLALENTAHTDALCERLGNSPMTPKLERLSLAMGTMSEVGVRALVRSAPKLRHVQLEVSDRDFGPEKQAGQDQSSWRPSDLAIS